MCIIAVVLVINYSHVIATPMTTPLPLPPLHKKILEELSWSSKLKLLKDYIKDTEETRRVGMAYLIRADSKRRDNLLEVNTETSFDDENNMRLKLFRLMYETVRDSDLKVKRAELMRSHYSNSSAFEIGYLMGDLTDKFNVMGDISTTLKRLYHEWKPIEHINAYEQIANQAIEINHLIDMMRTITKRDESDIADS